jgi:hypothetical protein
MQVGITINIVNYFPSDFNFSEFNFIFIYDTKQIDKGITYLKKNNIFHKLFLPGKKDVKYSVRMFKNESLIGLSEFIIPFSVFHKKQSNYEKAITIQMTDTLKKLIFGSSTTNNQIKINIHSSLQYIDGPLKERSLKKNHSNLNEDIYEKKLINTLKGREPKLNRLICFKSEFHNHSISNRKDNTVNISNRNIPKNSKIMKNQRSNPFPHTQIASPKRVMHNAPSTELKKHMNLNLNINSNTGGNSKILYEKNNKIINEELNEANIEEEDQNDNSVIDKDLEKDEQYNNKDKKVFEFIDNLVKENPLSEIDNKKDIGEMIMYTKDIITQLLEYQIKYYDILKKSVDMNHKLNELLLKYNEKYRLIIKKMNKLNEENNTHDMKNELIINNNQNDKNNINEIINMKNKELDIFKDIYKIQNDIDNSTTLDNNNNVQLTILLNALQKIITKYGPLNELITVKNASEKEIGDLNHILNKYKEKLDINQSNINTKENIDLAKLISENQNQNDDGNYNKLKTMEYVLSEYPDELDLALNKHLKNIYSNNRKLQKILFKRIGKNIYEYGTQKIIIKKEDNIIKVRYGGIFCTLEKYIETNSSNEYAKKTLSYRKNSKKLTNKSK